MTTPLKDGDGDLVMGGTYGEITESDGDIIMDDISTVNIEGLNDNCYYVTAAKLADVDTVGLRAKTAMPARVGGARSIGEIQGLFRAAGVSANVQQFTSLDAARAALITLGRARGGDVERFGLAFRRTNGTGHMVIALYRRDHDAAQFRDYQQEAGPDATDDLATGAQFFLFS